VQHFTDVILPNKSDVSAGSVLLSQNGLYASLGISSQIPAHALLAMLAHFCLLSANFLPLRKKEHKTRENDADVAIVSYSVKEIILFYLNCGAMFGGSEAMWFRALVL